MRSIAAPLCVLFLTAPAVAAALTSRGIASSPVGNAAHPPGHGARTDFLNAETSANGLGYRQFVTSSTGDTSWSAFVNGVTNGNFGRDASSLSAIPDIAPWALLVSGLGLAGSLLRRHSPAKSGARLGPEAGGHGAVPPGAPCPLRSPPG